MKLHVYFSVLIIFGYLQSSTAKDITPYDIKDDINGLFDSLREAIPEVIPISLDVELPENEYLTGNLNIKDGQITGLKEFIADVRYTLIIPTGFTLALDSLNVYLEYLADLVLFNIPLLSIFGEGPASISLTNLTIDGKISYQLIPAINLTVNSVHLGLADAQFDFEGLLNDETFSHLLNGILNDNVAKLINENEGAISGLIEDVINTLIGSLLSNAIINENQIMENNNYTEEEGIVKVFEILVEAIKSKIR